MEMIQTHSSALLYTFQMKVEEIRGTDAHLEAMLGQLEIKQPEGLICDNKKMIERMCINPNCKEISLLCADYDCSSCKSEAHMECTSVPLNGITSRLQRQTNKHKDFVLSMCQIENQFTSQLQKTRLPFAEKYCFGNLEQKYVQVIQKIYSEKQFKFLNGKEAQKFWNRIQKLKINENSHIFPSFLDTYHQKFQDFFSEIIDLKAKIYQAFSCQRELMIKKNEFEIDSLILSDKFGLLKSQKQEQIDFLRIILNNPVKVERIFRASEFDFRSSDFHEKCDGKNNTLILVRTEFNKTIGGFTHYPWSSPGNCEYVSDIGCESFIFSLEMKQKFVSQSHKNLIIRFKDFGPTFGANLPDIWISDQCKANRNSSASFPNCYNRSGQNKYKRSQESTRMFSGATIGSFFKVLEYEIFVAHYE